MKKVVINGSEFIIGGGYSLLRVWRRLHRTCWTLYSEEPKVNPAKIYALRVLPAGEGQSQDWPELEWYSASQLLAEMVDL